MRSLILMWFLYLISWRVRRVRKAEEGRRNSSPNTPRSGHPNHSEHKVQVTATNNSRRDLTAQSCTQAHTACRSPGLPGVSVPWRGFQTMQMWCSGLGMRLAVLGQGLDSLIPRLPKPEDSMTHWCKQKQTESHTSSNSSPNPTGLEMAVEISSASSCCSAMSCINSSTLSMSLEKKGKNSVSAGTFPINTACSGSCRNVTPWWHFQGPFPKLCMQVWVLSPWSRHNYGCIFHFSLQA